MSIPLGAVVAVGGAELLLHLIGFSDPEFHEPDPLLGKRLRAGYRAVQSREGHAVVAVNGHGFRDVEWSVSKAAHVSRVAFVGDSFIEAAHVPFEDTVVARVAEILNRDGRSVPVEVMNFGVSGYGTAQELLLLRDRVAKFSPDVVVLAIYAGNDPAENHPLLAPDKHRSFIIPSVAGEIVVPPWGHSRSRAKQWLTDHSRIWQLRRLAKAERRARGLRAEDERLKAEHEGSRIGDAGAAFGREVYAYDYWNHPSGQQVWNLTSALITRFVEETRAIGARPVITTIGTPLQVHPDREMRRRTFASFGIESPFGLEEAVQRLSDSLEVPHIGLGSRMQVAASESGGYFHGFDNFAIGIGHWNTTGHSFAAEALSPVIAEQLP